MTYRTNDASSSQPSTRSAKTSQASWRRSSSSQGRPLRRAQLARHVMRPQWRSAGSRRGPKARHSRSRASASPRRARRARLPSMASCAGETGWSGRRSGMTGGNTDILAGGASSRRCEGCGFRGSFVRAMGLSSSTTRPHTVRTGHKTRRGHRRGCALALGEAGRSRKSKVECRACHEAGSGPRPANRTRATSASPELSTFDFRLSTFDS